MHFVLPDRFQIELFRAGVVELCKLGGVMDITSLGGGREATHLHVLNEPFSQWCHSDPSDWIRGYGNNHLSSLEELRARHHYRATTNRPPLWPLSTNYREAV
jgi:hypothetical protein